MTDLDATRRIPPPPRSSPLRPGRSPEPAPSPNPTPATRTDVPANMPPTVIMITPWLDPLVDEVGHDPRSRYVEYFWLGVLGPTATWLIRRLIAGLEREPAGYQIDLSITAQSMGMSYSSARSSPFAKALQRCTMFGLAHQTSYGLAVRRRIPDVAHRHLRRMPEAVRLEHDSWHHEHSSIEEFARAHRLAVAMLEAGDDVAMIEHQLVALGIGAATAAEVADNAAQL